MAIGGLAYWVVVGALLIAVGIGHGLYVSRLKERGYWMPNGDALLIPMFMVVLLAAVAVAQIFGE